MNKLKKWDEIVTWHDLAFWMINNKDHPLYLPWYQMLEDSVHFGENYTINDFIDEGWQQANKGKLQGV